MRYYKRIEELHFTDNFMFQRVMSNPKNIEIVKRIAEKSIGKKIKRITRQPRSEVSVQSYYLSRGARFDIQFEGEDEIVSLEMQTYSDDLLFRQKKYHAQMFMQQRNASQDKHTYVIFICTYDYFGYGLPKYTLNLHIDEKLDAHIDEKRTTIILNPTAKDPGEFKALFDYLLKKMASDELTNDMKEAVEEVKKDDEAINDYMTLQEIIDKEKEETQKENALAMLKKNLSKELVSECTGLSLEEVEKLHAMQ